MSSFYQELLSANVLVPFSGIIEGENKRDGVKHFVAPSGMNSVVKHFLHSSGVLPAKTNNFSLLGGTVNGLRNV